MHVYFREPFNAISHLIGALLSIAALLAMVMKAVTEGLPTVQIVSVILFGASLICLYTASTVYHSAKGKPETVAFLRKLDHSMIFLLIAGSYAPFCLIALDDRIGWTVFGLVAFFGISGILFKMVWFHSPRWLSTAIYIIMGWIIVIAIVPLSESLSSTGLGLLIAGGIMYTAGGIIYGVKPNFLSFKYAGFHEIFHIFILLGSLCHFLAVYFYVL